MITYLWNLEQGSPEWLEKRKNLISATDAYDLLNGMSISDILQRKQSASFTGSTATQRGHDLEPQARELYSQIKHTSVKTCGMILNDKFPLAGMSPDGVLDDGLIEIKSFEYAHHQDLHLHLDAHVLAQIQFQLLISELQFVDLVQYCPDAPTLDETIYIKRIYPDQEIQQKLKQALLSSQADDLDLSQIIALQQSIQAFESQFGKELHRYQSQKEELENLKQHLKQITTGKISKTVQYGDNTLKLSIYDTHRVIVDDPNLIPDEYHTPIELDNAYEKDGKIYQDSINTKLAQNLLKAGKSLPPGFKDNSSRTISIKFNGKAL